MNAIERIAQADAEPVDAMTPAGVIRWNTFATIAAVVLGLGTFLEEGRGDWPQWRGPNRNGISQEKGWIDRWPDSGPKILWRAQVGLGFSSFVATETRAYTAGHSEETDTVFCFDTATGKIVWKHSYPAELGDKYFDGGTTGTPTLNEGHLYWLSRWGDVFCFQASDGKVAWTKNIQTETGARNPDWGFTGAPLVMGDLVVVNVGDAGTALDRATGKIRWKSAPQSAGYSTPLPVKRGDETWVWMGSAQSYVASRLNDGREMCRIRWLTQYGVNAADPVVLDDRVFISSGYGKGSGLHKCEGTGSTEVWKSKGLRSQLNGPVLFQEHLFGVDGDTTEKAALKCLEFSTGTVKWTETGFGSGGVIVVDGRLVALSGTGELMVAPVSSSEFKPTSRAQVLGGKCWTAPVLSDGLIFCRNSKGDVVVADVRKK